MTIRVEIEVPCEIVLKGGGSDYLDRAVQTLGWSRGLSAAPLTADEEIERKVTRGEIKPFVGGALDNYAPVAKADDVEVITDESGFSVGAGAAPLIQQPKRERGKPSQGRARRTKEEIAEDDAADRADAAKQDAAVDANLTDDVKPAISSGEERVSPEDQADADQDAADEAAETAKTGLAPIDELRRLVGQYQKAHGMPAAVALCQEGGLIGKGIHDLAETELPVAIEKMQTAVRPTTPAPNAAAGSSTQAEAANAAEQVAATGSASKPATKEDVQTAMLRYALTFDGQNTDLNKMPHTMADCPTIFTMLFGDAVSRLSQVPVDGYGRAVAAIDEAIQKDPFKRGVK